MGFVEKHRAEIIVLIVLPISFLIFVVRRIKKLLSSPAPAEHAQRAARVAATVEQAHAALLARQSASVLSGATEPAKDEPGLLRTDRSVFDSHSVRNSNKKATRQVPLRDLRAILGISTIERSQGNDIRVVHVEPGVTVGDVTSYLLKQNPPLQLECTLEMEDATLGGLAMAQGMTTHSHICGLVSETVEEYEIVTGRGEIITVTAHNEHGDLYRALPLSHGTLGLLVSLKLRVVPAQRWVRLRYRPLRSLSDLSSRYVDILNKGRVNDPSVPFFAEAIMFSKDESVLMEGFLSAGPDSEHGEAGSKAVRVNKIGRWYKPWFYKHVQSMLRKDNPAVLANGGEFSEELIPIRDYLMRHDRAMCMTMGTLVPYGNHWLFRLLLGWLLPPQMSFLKASHTAETREASVRKQCYQDVCFPARLLSEAVALSGELFDIYPLLVYPCKISANSGRGMVPTNPMDVDDQGISMNLNLGIYGIPKDIRVGGSDTFFPMVTRVRRLEEWLRSVGGFQHTYCDSFQTEQEFEQMFDHGLYDDMREAYGANGVFPRVYAKTRPEVDVWAWKAEEEQRDAH